MVNGEKNNLLDAADLTLRTLISASTGAGHKVVSLVTMPKKRSRGYLNGLAGYADRSWWMIGCKCMIQVINYVLDRLDFKEQIVKTILKVENTFKYKCDQTGRWQKIILPKIHHKIRCNSKGLKLQRSEVKGLALARADSGGWYRKIYNERYLFCIW